MKIIKKSLACTLSAILALSAFSPAVSAANGYDISNLVKPDGYVDGKADYEYVMYNDKNNTYNLHSYYDFQYNYLFLELSKSAEWDDVYEKYCKELDFDVALSSDWELYDVPDENDNMIKPETVENKYNSIKKMVDKMYNDGIIVHADYTPVRALYKLYQIRNVLLCSFDGTEDELSDIIKKYSDNAVVKSPISNGSIYPVEFFDIQSLSELENIRSELKASENISNGFDVLDTDLSVKFSSYGFINLLDPYICDIDNSGEADISDATQILQAYAENMAGVQRTAVNDKMDVNGDGEINIDDVTYVLTYYAESCAGLR